MKTWRLQLSSCKIKIIFWVLRGELQDIDCIYWFISAKNRVRISPLSKIVCFCHLLKGPLPSLRQVPLWLFYFFSIWRTHPFLVLFIVLPSFLWQWTMTMTMFVSSNEEQRKALAGNNLVLIWMSSSSALSFHLKMILSENSVIFHRCGRNEYFQASPTCKVHGTQTPLQAVKHSNWYKRKINLHHC